MRETIAQAIFGKPIHSVELADIVKYFQSAKRETDTLEFKSYVDFNNANTTKNSRDKEKLNAVIRTICAFLNSDGGVLIWGAPEGKSADNSKEMVFEGNLTPVDLKLEPDQFVNRIAAEISPVPMHVQFHAVPVSQDSYCYIFETAKSEFAPHQFKGTYYMRMDGSTRPAPHHYVEALMKKISYPKLAGHIEFGSIYDLPGNFAALPLQLTLDNFSKYLHEKNLQYRLLADTCDILDPHKMWHGLTLANRTDISKLAKDILHYRMPYYEDFVLITKSRMPRSQPLDVKIMLTFWGDLSPATASLYRLNIFGSNTVLTAYSIIEQKENFHLDEIYNEKTVSEVERNKNSRQSLMADYQKRINNSAIFRQLRNL